MDTAAAARARSLANEIDQAAAQLAASPAAAERLALAVLKAAPGDPRATLILASARRRHGDHAGARLLLEPLARAHPRAARTQFELGLVRIAAGEAAAGAAALRRAVAVDRDLVEAWRALGDALFAAGEVAEAEAAFAEHARASVSDPALKPAAEALCRGDVSSAEQLRRRRLEGSPRDVAALHMLAQALNETERYGEAERVLAVCLTLEPGFDAARFAYADALFHQQKAVEALRHLEQLLAKHPREAAYRNLMAAVLGLVSEHDRAIGLYLGLLEDYPNQPRIWLNQGHALRTVGRGEEAAAAYRRCIALAPSLGDAYWGLANLMVAAFCEGDVHAMQAQLRRSDLSEDGRLHFAYALGKALEDRGDYGGSFERYAQGAAIRRSKLAYDAGQTTAFMRKAEAAFTPALFAAHAGAGSQASDPIFVVGLPRSGSTLVEQILASHPQVEGTMELPDIGFIAQRLGDAEGHAGDARAYLDRLGDIDDRQLAAAGAVYLDATRVHRTQGRPFFVDKMPNNFQHLGLIRLILPRAKIIDARRHPLGACFSTFKQHFAQGQSFSYDLDDLGRYYRDYVALMAHFDAVAPGWVHRVIYEDMVEDTEAQVRRLLGHCGLPFDPACLRFYETRRAVKTVSSEQVRRPIFRQGLEQWRNYEPWLTPLKAALGPALEHWR